MIVMVKKNLLWQSMEHERAPRWQKANGLKRQQLKKGDF